MDRSSQNNFCGLLVAYEVSGVSVLAAAGLKRLFEVMVFGCASSIPKTSKSSGFGLLFSENTFFVCFAFFSNSFDFC